MFINNFTFAQDNPRTLTFNRRRRLHFRRQITTNFTIAQINLGIVQLNGGGTLTLTGNNTYTGGTTINAGTLHVGAGGTSGSVGTGPVALNNSVLVFNRSDSLTLSGTSAERLTWCKWRRHGHAHRHEQHLYRHHHRQQRHADHQRRQRCQFNPTFTPAGSAAQAR